MRFGTGRVPKTEGNMTRVFIDGSAGTTGLRIYERLGSRGDVELLSIPEELRKDPAAKKEYLNSADIVFLCLPDAAAMESAALVENPATAVIDTSTAHRTAEGWTYGFPELKGQRELVKASKRIANPGCHASGFISLIRPLTDAGVLKKDVMLSCFSLTGYSGGGKKMIADYENAERSRLLDAPRMYALAQAHKHLPEMTKLCGLTVSPAFCPVVGDFYAGMEVIVPVSRADLTAGLKELKELYADYYNTGAGLVHFMDDVSAEGGFLSAGAYAGRDDMEISVSGNEERILLVSRFDNLGKGASGAALQNMNILTGADEAEGLNI